MILDLLKIKKARNLINASNSNYSLRTSFEGVGAIISNSTDSLKFMSSLSKNHDMVNDHRGQLLKNFFKYTSKRLTDILIRLQEINWKRTSLFYEVKPDTFTHPIDPIIYNYKNFLGLSIKDFHVELISFMDSLAPVIILSESDLKLKNEKSVPGWPDITKYSKSSYRKKISTEFSTIIDNCKNWLNLIKENRNILTHRNHERIIFGEPKDGLLFQLYDEKLKPEIVLPEVMYNSGNNVVDFELYSAFILSEIFVLLDNLGILIAQKINIYNNPLSQMYIREIPETVAKSIERLNCLLCR